MIELGRAHWSIAGIVDGFAMLTHWIEQKSRWIDLRAWPGKLLPVRDEWTRAVCPGATLAGWRQQTVWTWKAPDKRRTEVKLPKRFGYQTIGVLGGEHVLVPGWLGHDNHASPLAVAPAPRFLDERVLDGETGAHAQLAVVSGELLVWGGRVFRHAHGALAQVDDLPPLRSIVAVADGFVAVGNRRLVQYVEGRRTDKKLAFDAARAIPYEGAVLLEDGRRYWRYDDGEVAAFDLGVPEVDDLVAAPCGLIGLVGSALVRLRV